MTRRLKAVSSRINPAKPRLGAAGKRVDPFYATRDWTELAARVKAARGGRCEMPGCETPGDRVAADHVREIRDGGAPLDAGNIRLLCHRHHMQKTAAVRAARAVLA